MLKRKCKITFISHGETVHSQESILCDNEKYPSINDFGEEEMDKVCEYLKNREVAYDTIYACPSTRCKQSAQIIAELFKQKITKLDLPSRKLGIWNGRSVYELFNEYGKSFLNLTPENGEGLDEFNKRVSDTIDILVEKNKGNRIIVVTTQDVIQAALAKTLELTNGNQIRMLIKTGSLTQISYFDDGWSSVIYANFMPL